MKGQITTCDHAVIELPSLLSCDVMYTGTVPCDSFTVKCLYTAALEPVLRRAADFPDGRGNRAAAGNRGRV